MKDLFFKWCIQHGFADVVRPNMTLELVNSKLYLADIFYWKDYERANRN